MSEQLRSDCRRTFQWCGIHHVAVVTKDLDATIQFYEKVLEMSADQRFPATQKRGRHCFIKPGETTSWGLHFFEYPKAQIFQSVRALKRLAENKDSDALNQFISGSLQHIAFALRSKSDAEILRNKLSSHGVVMTEIYDQGSIQNFIFVDNNGIQLEAAWKKD